MKVEALARLLARSARLKVLVVTNDFCLCGYATAQQPTAAGLLVSIGESLRVMFGSSTVIAEPERSGTLLLSRDAKVTRRLQTHRRHLAGKHTVPRRG